MKNLILLLILVLSIVSVNVVSSSETIPTNVLTSKQKVSKKIDKQSSTNSSIIKIIADKEKVDKKKAVFDKNLNVALLTDEELKQLINDALLNCNNAELMELGTKLGKALKFDLTPIISSAILARTKCDLKKSQQRCAYALNCCFSELMSGKFSDETKKTMDEAIDGVPIGCQDWLTVNCLAGTTPYAMHIAIYSDNDFDKAWKIYKNTLLAIKACKNGSARDKKWAINGTIHSELPASIYPITRHKNHKTIKLSLENAKEIKKLIEQLPVKDFSYGEENRQNILKSIQKYTEEKNNSR